MLLPLTGDAPRQAQATRIEDQHLWLDLPGDRPQVGTRVIVEGPWAVRVIGTVAESDGPGVCIEATRAVDKDRRAAPRTMGGVTIRYAVATDSSEADAWMSRGELPAGSSWHAPDPFMSFSATGLEFGHRAIADKGDLLLIQLGLPRHTELWRATAKVVRVREIPAAEQEVVSEGDPAVTHRVAVHFERIGRQAREALVARSLEIMRARSRL